MITAALDSTHDITWQKLTGDEAIHQAVMCELAMLLGDWFLDVTIGIPWYANPNASATPIMGTLPANLPYASALIKAAILGVPGVASISSFSLAHDHGKRTLSISAQIVTVTGGTLTIARTTP